MFEFYAGRNDRNRKIVFSDIPGYPDNGEDYENIFLKDIYPIKGLKLYYLFDFGDNWICKSICVVFNRGCVGRNVRILIVCVIDELRG